MEEREEGELSEGDLSDISSEEEYLLRQRLQVLESYNNVLERKDRRRRSGTSQGHKKKADCQGLLPDLSEISGSDLENSIILNISSNDITKKFQRKSKTLKSTKNNNRPRKSNTAGTSHRKNDKLTKHRLASKKESVKHSKQRSQKVKRKKPNEVKVVPESSDDTDYEYRNKRRRLQHSVQISNPKSDFSTLKMRLMNMFTDKTNSQAELVSIEPLYHDKEETLFDKCDELDSANPGPISEEKTEPDLAHSIITSNESLTRNNSSYQNNFNNDSGSDDDIELLRQIALQTKLPKPPIIESEPVDHISDSDDSHELRVICLKSSLLKRALAMKQKKKLRNRIRTMSSIDDILASKLEEDLYSDGSDEHNNTDIESVDMEIGVSDGPDTDIVFKKDEKLTDKTVTPHSEEVAQSPPEKQQFNIDENIKMPHPIDGRLSAQSNEKINTDRGEDLEEDEDLLRTKLLTSLSRNLTDKTGYQKKSIIMDKNEPTSNKNLEPETKKFIINIGESDSGSDDEATKNLTKMHMRLSENVDFQQRLDLFLKNARMETEHKILPNATDQAPKQPTSGEKFVPKAVNHLPKSGQMEYKRLVKRMAELERLKLIRQASLIHSSNNTIDKNIKNTLKNSGSRAVQKSPKTVHVEDRTPPLIPDLESQIALSRKRIAAESAKVLQLKEQSNQLVQQYKDAVAELHRVRSAMFINRKEERAVQVSLANMRNQHQILLKRSKMPTNKSAVFGNSSKKIDNTKMQYKKSKEDHPNMLSALQTMKMGKVNNSEKNNIPELSVQLDLSTNKNTVILPKEVCDITKTRKIKKENPISAGGETMQKMILNSKNNCAFVDHSQLELKPSPQTETVFSEFVAITPEVQSDMVITREVQSGETTGTNDLDDYKSPLTSMKFCMSLEGDPHGILCPFEVCGTCKDAGCKYMHPKVEN